MENDVQKTIAEEIKTHKVMLYVKGNRAAPQCGFSKAVMDIFDRCGATYETRDVLSDPDLRDGIKQFTSWPTIPQIFVNGEFVGGCDIVREMFQKGELQELLKKTGATQ